MNTEPSSHTMEALQISEERFRSAFEFAAIGMALVAPDGRWLQVNHALCELVGYTEQELLQIDFQTISHPADLDSDLDYVQKLLAGTIRSYQMEKRYIHKDGRIVWILLSVSLLRDANGQALHFISQIQDITARKHLEEELRAANARLETLASSDGLTGLKNYRAFSEQIIIEWQRARRHSLPLSLVMLDIDGFKRFNDSYGHPAGDRALSEIGRILQASARTSDCAARYGGEEFALILPHTDHAGAQVFAERLRISIEQAVWDKAALTASIGVATLGQEHQDCSDLIDAADQALYHSKAKGRNRVTHARSLALYPAHL